MSESERGTTASDPQSSSGQKRRWNNNSSLYGAVLLTTCIVKHELIPSQKHDRAAMMDISMHSIFKDKETQEKEFKCFAHIAQLIRGRVKKPSSTPYTQSPFQNTEGPV